MTKVKPFSETLGERIRRNVDTFLIKITTNFPPGRRLKWDFIGTNAKFFY